MNASVALQSAMKETSPLYRNLTLAAFAFTAALDVGGFFAVSALVDHFKTSIAGELSDPTAAPHLCARAGYLLASRNNAHVGVAAARLLVAHCAGAEELGWFVDAVAGVAKLSLDTTVLLVAPILGLSLVQILLPMLGESLFMVGPALY
eukprot:scaffold2360_cov380-Prasinococcus_capsulatus_cf.AAC.17